MTARRRFAKVAQQVEQAAESAKEAAKEAGRDLDDTVRHTADGITDEIEQATGQPIENKWMRIMFWLIVAGIVAAFAYLLSLAF